MAYVPQRGAAYGDIFTVDTPHIDQLSNLMFQEQRQRQAKQQAESATMDAALQKEIGQIRSADTPDVVNGYQKWKANQIRLQSDKKLRRDPLAFDAAQKESQLALADLYSTINQSKEQKQRAIDLRKDFGKTPDLFDDNFAKYHQKLISTPVKQLNNINDDGAVVDLTTDEPFRYKGPNTDFADILKKSAGDVKPNYNESTPVDNEGLQTKTTPYMFGNSPAQVKSALEGHYALRGAGRDAAAAWDQTTQEEKDNIVNAFKAIPPEKWKRMGLDGPQDLIPRNPMNKSESLAALQAMKYAVENEPKAGKEYVQDNMQAILDKRAKMAKEMENLRAFNDRKAEKLKADLKGSGSAEEKDSNLNKFMTGVEDRAIASGNKYVIKANGKERTVYQVPISPSLAKAFERIDKYGAKTQPNAIGYDKNTREYFPLYYRKEQGKDGNYTGNLIKNGKGEFVFDELSAPLSREVVKAEMANALLTPKSVEGELEEGNANRGGPKAPRSKQASSDDDDDELINQYLPK